MQIAAQCGYGNNYHIHTLDVVAEFLDANGDPVPPGQPGNVILTRLHAGPMPIVRYAIGDVGIGGGMERCPCGRGFELMKSVQGRDTDVVVTPSGNRLIVHFFTATLKLISELDCFQVIHKERDLLLIRVVPTQSSVFDKDLEMRIVQLLRSRGLTDMRIVVEPVAEIPLTRSGKRRFIISELPRVFH
jgi:phenylacetate-CoA ligase